METFLQDVRHGVRLLARAPGFTLDHPDRARRRHRRQRHRRQRRERAAAAAAAGRRPFARRSPVRGTPLQHALPRHVRIRPRDADARRPRAVHGAASVSLRTGASAPEPFFAEFVGGDYFDLLGVRAALGRTFLPTEARTPGSSPVVVLTHRGWQRKFGGDASAIGREAFINGQAFTIVGVMPPEFTGMMSPIVPDVFIPLMMDPVVYPGSTRLTTRSSSGQMFGRMKPGVTVAQVQAEMTTIHQVLAARARRGGRGRGRAGRARHGRRSERSAAADGLSGAHAAARIQRDDRVVRRIARRAVGDGAADRVSQRHQSAAVAIDRARQRARHPPRDGREPRPRDSPAADGKRAARDRRRCDRRRRGVRTHRADQSPHAADARAHRLQRDARLARPDRHLRRVDDLRARVRSRARADGLARRASPPRCAATRRAARGTDARGCARCSSCRRCRCRSCCWWSRRCSCRA